MTTSMLISILNAKARAAYPTANYTDCRLYLRACAHEADEYKISVMIFFDQKDHIEVEYKADSVAEVIAELDRRVLGIEKNIRLELS